jgi:DNA-binding NarL/FixJ family response regulator
LARIGGRTAAGGLTATEERIARLVAAGRSNKEIANELFVTVRTVEAHLTKVYSKLALHSRTELASHLCS